MKRPRFELPSPTFVPLDGIETATYELMPDAPTAPLDVVFCHGTPWSAQVWAQAALHVGNGRRVLLWDMPGYGRSAQNRDVRVDLPAQMSRLAQLLELWQVTEPWVVAHDIGGAVALGAHLLHGCDFGGLFLWDVVTLEPWGSEFFRLVADYTNVFEALPPPLHGALVSEYIAGAAHRRLDAVTLSLLSAPWVSQIGQTAFYRQIAQLRAEHTRPIVDRLSQVRCNSSIGWGEEDPWIPVEQAVQLQHSLPGHPDLTTLAGVGHLAPIEAPALVAQALDAWLPAT
ncbi:MAG: alpha/beta hydrolase [Rhodococcus sp. (in: high G+C Gram-positive bacteria)]|uniref:alpha/beta fold hydrolase n=1 Tax=Rhodococcus sp. TaxID=1831 RepID=UPI002AD7E171|nr:alpha/beta hydrolase [Rhodococcus sp. (in: high G+C Gram-positive bacteria)]